MPRIPNLPPFRPPARLAAALVVVLFLTPLLAAQACSPAGPEEDSPEAAADAGSDDPAAGDLGGDELQAATPNRPDTGLDDDIETAPPDTAPDEPSPTAPAGFEDTVQRTERASEDAPPVPPSEPVALTSVWIHLLSPGDDEDGDEEGGENGDGEVLVREAGEVIGCGDVVVAVAVPVEAEVSGPEDRVRVALEALFGLGRQRGGQGVPDDLANALARSSLEVDRVEPVPDRPGSYRAHLRGELRLGGVCDAPRVRAQIEGTAERAEGVEEVQVFLDGEPLDAVLSARGG